MALRHVKVGETIIKEGDHGDMMYIVDHGEFNVSKRDEDGVNQAVITYTTSGVAFGELALMYRQKRAVRTCVRSIEFLLFVTSLISVFKSSTLYLSSNGRE